MIDIHTHILPFVDDGSTSTEISIGLLQTAVEQGVTDVICTPHHRQSYLETTEKIKQVFEEFKSAAEKANIPVNLYLGQEIYVSQDIKTLLRQKQVLTMAGTKYVLVEFDFARRADIPEIVYEIKTAGFIPIVAHLERYKYASINDAFEIKDFGGLIQVNADSLVGAAKRENFGFAKKLFKEGLVDFVASDIHDVRPNCIKDAAALVKKKFGNDAFEKVFITNAKKILEGQS